MCPRPLFRSCSKHVERLIDVGRPIDPLAADQDVEEPPDHAGSVIRCWIELCDHAPGVRDIRHGNKAQPGHQDLPELPPAARIRVKLKDHVHNLTCAVVVYAWKK